MTSDAKIGLLLGLSLIFIIAFVVNGLPNFRKDAGSNELTTTMVERQMGLADRERQVTRRVISPPPPIQSPAESAPAPVPQQEDVRFIAQLPSGTGPGAGPSIVETAEVRQILNAPAQGEQIAANTGSRQTLPAPYTVRSGDILPVIAKKFYGPEEGNRLVNINRIYEANRNILKSPDQIYPGQKIVIPPLPSVQNVSGSPESTLVSRIFETVQSIGQRHLSADDLKPESAKYYVVKEKDNLWKIAATELGDGKRYIDIRKLNTDVLEDSDNISVGLRLKLPVR